MNFKWVKNIALVLCVGLIYIFGSLSVVNAQAFLPQDDSLTKINEYAAWTDAGKKKKAEEEAKKKAEEEAKKKQEGAAPESIAKPKSYQEVLDDLTPWKGSSSSTCSDGYHPANQDAGTTPNSAGLFSPEIMVKMQAFMRQIYKELSKVFMIGHSLLCYAQKVAYLCIGVWGKCFAKLANLNLFVSGMLIYIVGVLMTMSIGMYFVDISFKLGFAMLFMPVSIALWPFPPTKNKFQENLSIIIRNGMLFTLVAIGVTFAVTLISNSLVNSDDGRDGWMAFWEAVSNKQTEYLIDLFSFDRMHFLVVAFALIFGFKILASSVNDYLDYFFSDSVFGSESPMHHMGTQAIGMAAANTIKPAASFIKDVAKTQTGRAIAGVGGGIVSLGSKEGRAQLAGNVKKFAGAVANPRKTYNAAMGKLGEKTNQAVQGMGSLVKGAANVGTLFMPVKESYRKELEKRIDDKIDKATKAAGNWAEDKVAHGGGQLRHAAANPRESYNAMMEGLGEGADMAIHGAGNIAKGAVKLGTSVLKKDTRDRLQAQAENAVDGFTDKVGDWTKNKIAHGGGELQNMAANAAAAGINLYNEKVLGNDSQDDIVTRDDVKEAVGQSLKSVQDDLNAAGRGIKSGAKAVAGGAQKMASNIQGKAQNVAASIKRAPDVAKNAVAGAAAMVYNDIQSLKNTPENAVTAEAMRAFMGEERRKLAQATRDAWKNADKAPITLNPSNILSTIKRKVTDEEEFKRTFKKLPDVFKNIQQAKEQKVILKTTGQIVLRTIKDASSDIKSTAKATGSVLKNTAESTSSVFGNILKDFGNSLQNNKPAGGQSKHKWTSWKDMEEAAQRKKEAAQEDRDYFKSINTYDDD